MPVIVIAGVAQKPEIDISAVLTRMCTRLADVEGTESRHWWGTWQPLAPGAYVEGSEPSPAVQPPATHGPIVEIRAFTGRSPELIERLITAAADTLARELDLEPGNVFVTWTELQPGRVSTGGQIRR
jgi:phenylpyruvate tautomerase PptA (4-oxalocrotonate tautomerase family)